MKDIRCGVGSDVLYDLIDEDLTTLSHWTEYGCPLNGTRLIESKRPLPHLAMFSPSSRCEDHAFAVPLKILEIGTLGMSAGGAIDFSCRSWIRKGYLSRSNQNYWAVFFVPLVDLLGS